MPPSDELDLDPIELVPSGSKSKEPKAPKSAGPKPKGGKGKGGEAPERKSVAGSRKVPYPLSPADVPDDLTDYADSYVSQQNKLLAGLFVFLIFYIGMILFFALIAVWCVWSFKHLPLVKIAGIGFSGIFFLYLVKGFFKRQPMNKEMHLEITEEEQPVLFEFIYKLCDELDAPLPNRVFVSPDVNAAVMPRTSLFNLFIEPKKDLLIGLGLVNSVSLSEFKAVLAHEFGHFSQSAMASSYTYVASRIIGDLVEGEDWFDRMVNWCKKQENVFSVVGHAIGAPLWVGRKILEQCYKVITLQRLVVSREREFHADLVAVSAAGSNAVVHCLLRTDFGHQCFIQAVNDLATAMDHKLYSNDLYLHQDRAATVVRRKKKEPQLGLPPLLVTPNDGKDVEVFDAEEEEMTDEIPPMWRTHPSNSDREKNAKEQFVPAVVDHRSPWILFDEPADLRERMTYKFYRMAFQIPKNAELADAVRVQKFIDNEHADTTYDPKYKGAYDDRPLEPGDLAELNGIIRESPWAADRMEKVLDKLYDGCEEHAEAHAELYKEEQSLRSGIVGRPSPKMKRKLEENKEKQDENWEWFKSFDRRAYLLHVQMAAHVDPDLKNELVERYRFQLEVQRLYQEARAAFQKADDYLGAYAAAARGELQVGPDFPGEVIQVLRGSWKALKNIIKDAREINLPAMKNFEEGDNLADFILEGKMVPEPPLSYVKGVWIDKLMTQLRGVRLKCFRLHFKSVGGILRMHETISAQWRAQREPVAAEVLDAVPIAAEVIPAEVIPAEVVPAAPVGNEVVRAVHTPLGRVDIVRRAVVAQGNVIDAEVLPDEPIAAEIIAAEVIDAVTLPAEPLPAVQAHAVPPEPPKSVAAFVAPAAPAVPDGARGLHSPSPTAAHAVPPPVVPPPEPLPVPVSALPSADPFDLLPPAPPLPAVAPAIDLEATQPAPKLPQPLAFPEPAAPAPVAQLPADAVGQLLALDTTAPTAASDVIELDEPSKPSAPPLPMLPAIDIFSMDSEEMPVAKSSEAVFSLDADPYQSAPAPAIVSEAAIEPAPEVVPAVAQTADATPAPAPAAAKPVLSDSAVVEVPASKAGFGSGVAPALGKADTRPRLKITIVKPGEKSPLAK